MNTPANPAVSLYPIALPASNGGLTVYLPTDSPHGRTRASKLGTAMTLPASVWRELLRELFPKWPPEPRRN